MSVADGAVKLGAAQDAIDRGNLRRVPYSTMFIVLINCVVWSTTFAIWDVLRPPPSGISMNVATKVVVALLALFTFVPEILIHFGILRRLHYFSDAEFAETAVLSVEARTAASLNAAWSGLGTVPTDGVAAMAGTSSAPQQRSLFSSNRLVTLAAAAGIACSACICVRLAACGYGFAVACTLFSGLLIAYLQVELRNVASGGGIQTLLSPAYRDALKYYLVSAM
jgi:hypothetical protein